MWCSPSSRCAIAAIATVSTPTPVWVTMRRATRIASSGLEASNNSGTRAHTAAHLPSMSSSSRGWEDPRACRDEP